MLRRNARIRWVQWSYALSYDQSSTEYLSQLLDEHSQSLLGPYDQKYFHRLLQAMQQAQPRIDDFLASLLDRELKATDRIELNILRLACLELSPNFNLPPKVVINEAIEIAKGLGATESFKFINGVLHLVVNQLPLSFIEDSA